MHFSLLFCNYPICYHITFTHQKCHKNAKRGMKLLHFIPQNMVTRTGIEPLHCDPKALKTLGFSSVVAILVANQLSYQHY